MDQRRQDMRARNWGALFENLRLAVDKIYSTCEQDQSIPECKETILYIETYLHEFNELKKLLELKREHDFDNNNGKSLRGISWEIRKTSPGPRRHDEKWVSQLYQVFTVPNSNEYLNIF